ncbi:MAG: Peptidase family [Planctomycetota bacterium]
MLTTIGRRIAWIAALALLLAGCTVAPDLSKPEGRRKAATDLVERLGEKRDRAPHDNPKASEIERSFIEAYALAETPRERDVALVKLVDQFSDGHARVDPPKGSPPLHAPSCSLGQFDGRIWIEFSGRSVNDGLPPEGRKGRYCVELLAIDGYAPKGLSAARALLASDTQAPVTLECRMIQSGAIRTIALERDGDWRRSVRPEGVAEPPPPPDAEFVFRHPRFPDAMYAAVLSESPKVGLVRLPWMSPPGAGFAGSEIGQEEIDCVVFHKPCADLTAMLDCIRAVADCEWIVIDLRGSGGGICAHAGAVCAAILPTRIEKMPFRHLDMPLILDLLGNGSWEWKRSPLVREDARFAVLIDGGCASASEHIAGVLRALPSTLFVGSRTAGSEYSLATNRLPDGTTVRFGGNPGLWDGLDLVEGRGVAPSVPVAFDLEVLRRKGIEACVRDHRARTLDAALAAIREAAAEPASAAH